MVNAQFKIVQTGNALPEMLLRDYEDLIGLSVDKVLRFTKPVLAGKISWLVFRPYEVAVCMLISWCA